MIDWNRVCPFCGSVMVGTNGHPICHSNPDCVIHDESIPQELLDKLETTRKALDVAVDALKGRHEYYEYCATRHVQRWDWVALTIDEDILQALEQINEITKGGKDAK